MALTILVAEDDPDIRLLIARQATHRGHRVISAADGALAIGQALDEKPDVITLDLHMPRLDGRDAIARLKRDPNTRDIPIVVVSGDACAGRACLELGADDFIEKPFSAGYLLRKIELLMDERRKRRLEERNEVGRDQAVSEP